MTVKVIPSTCSECLVRCGSLVHVEDGNVVKITGNPDHPASQGAFCIKGMNAPIASRKYAKRITRPMRRAGQRGQGSWEQISWEQTFSEIAEKLAQIKTSFGPLAIAGAVANFNQSRGIAMRQLLRSLGSPNFMMNQDMCHGGRATAAFLTGCGGEPSNEIKHSKMIFVVGKSPSDSDVIEWRSIQKAKAEGAILVVVDSRRTQIARLADHWLQIKPGTDAALALAMLNVIFDENLIDRDFVAEYCIGAEDLEIRAQQYSPQSVEQITGIEAKKIIEVARLFATAKPASLIAGHGIDSQENGVYTAIAFQSLLAVTGNYDRIGTNRPTKRLPGFRENLCDETPFRLPREIEEKTIGAEKYPLWSGPDSWARSCHNPAVLHAIRFNDPYPVRAMYISGTNIVCTYPDHDETVAALKELSLLVVAADQMTPTAELADYFLPKTTLLEEEDVFTLQKGPCISLTQQILSPLGESKSDMDIAIGLHDALARLGAVDVKLFPWKTHEQFMNFLLKDTGIELAELRKKAYAEIPYQYETFRSKGFGTPSKKIELSSTRLKELGREPLPFYQAPIYHQSNGNFDLVLMTGIRNMAFHHSRFREHAFARRMLDAPEVVIHPLTAEKIGVEKGDWVWVETPSKPTRALLKVKVSEDVQVNTASTGVGWWYPEMNGPEYGSSVFSVGAAMAYGPVFDPISGSPEARNTACRLSKADTAEVERLLTAEAQPRGSYDPN